MPNRQVPNRQMPNRPMPIALTHVVPDSLERCELTWIDRRPIDLERAREQHAAYCQALERHGLQVHTLDANANHPDACFIEDVAVVLDEFAIMTSMGTPSRTAEVQGMEPVLARYRGIERIHLPATLEGGDVFTIGRTIYVGLSKRTNRAGITALASIVKHHGYHVQPIQVHGCLHLKTACTPLDDETVLLNPEWIDPAPLNVLKHVEACPEEPGAANVVAMGGVVLQSSSAVRTAERLADHGHVVAPIDISEFEKAEAGLTCLSLILR